MTINSNNCLILKNYSLHLQFDPKNLPIGSPCDILKILMAVDIFLSKGVNRT